MADPYVYVDYWEDGYTVLDTGTGAVPDDYPAIPQREGCKLTPRTGILLRRASNGTSRLRALQSAAKYDILVDHGTCTAAEYASLISFYAQYRMLSFTFTSWEDNVTRTCVFAPDPYEIAPLVGGLFKIKTALIEI